MAFLYDFIPVLLFFLAFKIYGIYVATVVGIAVSALQFFLTILIKKKIDRKQLFTLAVFLIFGSMTLYFHNPIFVKWKPSIIFWIFGVVIFLSQFTKKSIMQRMLSQVVEENRMVPQHVWRNLNLAWSLFFLSLGTLNIFIAYHFSTDAWVNFKFYGILGALILFSIVQAFYLSVYLDK